MVQREFMRGELFDTGAQRFTTDFLPTQVVHSANRLSAPAAGTVLLRRTMQGGTYLALTYLHIENRPVLGNLGHVVLIDRTGTFDQFHLHGGTQGLTAINSRVILRGDKDAFIHVVSGTFRILHVSGGSGLIAAYEGIIRTEGSENITGRIPY